MPKDWLPFVSGILTALGLAGLFAGVVILWTVPSLWSGIALLIVGLVLIVLVLMSVEDPPRP